MLSMSLSLSEGLFHIPGSWLILYLRWVAFTSGLAYITLPDDDASSALIPGGPFGLIFAADTKDVSVRGHRTQMPGITETITLQIPTADGKVPEHQVLHRGPCSVGDIMGISGYKMLA